MVAYGRENERKRENEQLSGPKGLKKRKDGTSKLKKLSY